MDFDFSGSAATADPFAPAAAGGFDGFGSALATAASTSRHELSRVQKAAVIVRLLLQAGIELPLADLPEEAQDELILNMTKIRTVDRDTVARVVDEFLAELDTIGLLFPGSMGRALEALGDQLSPTVTGRARAKLGLGDTYNPWEPLGEVESDRIAAALEAEGPETAAIVLSKLKVAKSAEILGLMPGKAARRVAYAMSQTAGTKPEIVDDIGRALYDQLRHRPAVAFDKGPAEVIGSILNASQSGTRDDVLQGLDETDKALADQVRKSIFTFANIPTRIDPRDVPKFLRNVDPKSVLVALAGCAQNPDDPIGPFILGNMSSRLAQQMKDDMEALGKVKAKDVDEAQAAVVAAIRDLADAGELVFKADDEDEEEE